MTRATGAPSPALATRMLEETRERGLLIGKGGLYGHTLRMAPPMNLSEAEAKEGLGILADALRAVNAGGARPAMTRTHRPSTSRTGSAGSPGRAPPSGTATSTTRPPAR